MPTIVSSFNQHFTRKGYAGTGESNLPSELFRLRPLVKQSPENYWIVKPTAVSIISDIDQLESLLLHAVIDSPLFGGQNHFESQYIFGAGTTSSTFSRSWWLLGSIFLTDGDIVSGEQKGGVFSPCSDNYCILKEVKQEVFRLMFIDQDFYENNDQASQNIQTKYFSFSLNFTEMSPK